MKSILLIVCSFITLVTFSQDAPNDTCTVSLPNSYSINANTAVTGVPIIFNCPVSAVTVKVYNRWGMIVHEETLENGTSLLKWDPSELPSGVYVYILKCNQLTNSNWEEKNVSNHITLITGKK